MKTTAEIQIYIFDKTGLKTGVRNGKGSMKGYFNIYPIFQNGSYPNIPHNTIAELKEMLPDFEPTPTFCTISEISIHESKGIINERVTYKKENKPKEIGKMNVKGWGSKNSQMRLDKAAARNAVKMKKGNTARYY